MTTTLFSDEVQLCGWSESHTSGAKVTFWLSDPAQLSAFRGLTERKGKTAGQRLAMVLAEIGDDEKLVEQPVERIPPQKEQLGPLCLLAVKWCDDEQFRTWLDERWSHIVKDFPYKSADLLKRVLEITSRKELDTNEQAGNRFHALIRIPYMKYLETLK